ncbi:MAG: rane protein [Streptosporangiaceae bacterium]|jgi:uncharacterized protein YlxW (UPF0749 family)|nr:rane protein [Streptosporangiaceae bacterium]
MSLLADLFAGEALDPGYARAAARRAAGGGPARSAGRFRHAGVLIVVVVTGLLLAMAGEQVRRSEPVAQKQRERLITEIRNRTDETDALQRRLGGLRTDTERLRAVALARSAEGRRARDELARAADAAAARAVSGSALRVILNDARPPDGPVPDTGRVFDQDLQILSNGLWAAGAGAIAINGQRLTPTTAIRTAGEAILVDYRPLSPPYEVTALGDPGRLQSRLMASAAGDHLRSLKSRFGIRFQLQRESEATVPAAVGLRLLHAQEVSPQ